jgi:hypothetical protein
MMWTIFYLFIPPLILLHSLSQYTQPGTSDAWTLPVFCGHVVGKRRWAKLNNTVHSVYTWQTIVYFGHFYKIIPTNGG